jgi:hypothetical protein
MDTYIVSQNGCNICVELNGNTKIVLDPNDAADIAAMLTRAVELYWEQYEDDRADERAEQAAYERSLELQESAAEAEYDRLGYNDIPF